MDGLHTCYLTPAQCRARAGFIRETADKATNETVRSQLLDIADQYEQLAARAEAGPSSQKRGPGAVWSDTSRGRRLQHCTGTESADGAA